MKLIQKAASEDPKTQGMISHWCPEEPARQIQTNKEDFNYCVESGNQITNDSKTDRSIYLETQKYKDSILLFMRALLPGSVLSTHQSRLYLQIKDGQGT